VSVAVHVVTFNSAATIAGCLEAALAQTGVAFQVRVLDNASEDDTCAIVRRMGVELVESDRNLGYAAAHNRLIDSSASDYVLTLNPDARLYPGFLAALSAALDAAPEVGSACGRLLRVETFDGDPVGIDGMGVFMRRSRRQGLLYEGAALDAVPETPFSVFGVDGACAFYRRAMLDDVRVEGEVFDADFFMHKEDIDVAWRARLRGWGALCVPAAMAAHVRSFRPGRRERVSAYMRCLGTRNRWLLLLKNEMPAGFWRDLPWIAGYDLAILAFLLLRERASLQAVASAWRLRGRMLAKRRMIQSRRRADWDELRHWFGAAPSQINV
jgi:GT2 family glycosyltransferase